MKKGDRGLNASQLSRPEFTNVYIPGQQGFWGKG